MTVHLDVHESDMRLDRYLAIHVPEYSRSYLQRLIENGCVTLLGKPLKSSWKTVAGVEIMVAIPEPEASPIVPEHIPLDIVYEDEWLLVVNKAQGMVVHPAPGHRDGTLVNALLDYCAGQLSDLNGVIRPGIVHRIDKDTSGLILVVKDNKVHADIAEKIRRHEIGRTYQAVVYGQVSTVQGTIDAPIGRDPRNRQRMAVVADGKPARTHFKVREQLNGATWLEVQLESGRTHQIRVHLQYIGHPVAGDPVYASKRPAWKLAGQALHAGALDFIHPVTGNAMHVTCPLPDWFQALLKRLA